MSKPTEMPVLVGHNRITLGSYMIITSKDGHPANIIVLPRLLKISAVGRFSRKLLFDKELESFFAKFPKSPYWKSLFRNEIWDSSNYLAVIKVAEDKKIQLWTLKIIFRYKWPTISREVYKRVLTLRDVERLRNYIEPYVPLLEESLEKRESGIRTTAYYLYHLLGDLKN